MSARTVLGKSAVVTCSLLLVSAYIYQRSGGELFRTSAREAQTPAVTDKFMPGPKSAPVWAATVGVPNAGRADTDRMSATPAGGKNPAILKGAKVMMQGTKSAMILLTFPGENPPSGAASRTGGDDAPQGAGSRQVR